jgi:hypothetical protein
MNKTDKVPEMTPDDFLRMVCDHYYKAARFILDWASTDITSVSEFMAAFLAKVFSELDVNSDYLYPKVPDGLNKNDRFEYLGKLYDYNGSLRHEFRRGKDIGITSFGNSRPSYSKEALGRFCELLNENPELIKQFRNNPLYPKDSSEDLSFFGDRQTNHYALTRGFNWNAPDFIDSCPVPRHLKHRYRVKRHNEFRNAENIRLDAEKKLKEEKIQKRYVLSQAKVERRKEESVLRKAEINEFLQKPLIQQVLILACDNTRPVKAFPIDPNMITAEVLEELDNAVLIKLSERIAKQRMKSWKELKQRILSMREDLPNDDRNN